MFIEGIVNTKQGYKELAQSKAAVFTAVGLLFFDDLVSLVIYFDITVVISIIIDVVLGINLIRGKRWARIWILVRIALGLVIVSFLSLTINDIASVILQAICTVAFFVLLTGKSTGARIGTGVALYISSAIAGVVLAILMPLTLLTSVHDANSLSSISVDNQVSGSISDSMEIDAFSFNAVEGLTYIIQTGTPGGTSPLADSLLTLWDTDGETILEENDDYGDFFTSRIDWTAPESGIFYVTVENADGFSIGDYTLIVKHGR